MVEDPREWDDLDVIARLREHQQNLDPPQGPLHTALVALPMPPICRVLHESLFEELRDDVLHELMAELGGGDGPVPILDFDDEDRPLDVCLEHLLQLGIERLVVHGAADQPGFARALFFRWPGELQLAERVTSPAGLRSGLLAPLMSVEPASLPLSDGVTRVAPGEPVPTEAEVVLVAVDGAGDPAAAGKSHPDARVYAHDPERSAAAWTGFVPRSGLWGSQDSEEVRDAWRQHWGERGQSAALRNAVLGHDSQLEQSLVGERVPAADGPEKRSRVFVVTGLDGSGKTTHAARLQRKLEEAGQRVRTIKIYRQGAFLELANELSARTRRGAALQCFRASRVVKLVDSLRTFRDAVEPALRVCDALVMDRYVETHAAAAASQLGWDLRGHPLLDPFPAADLVSWLRLPPDVAIARLQDRGEDLTADEHRAGLTGYARWFDELADEQAGDLVLDAHAPCDENAAAIWQRVQTLIVARDPLPTDGDPQPPAQAAVRVESPSGRRCEVVVGQGSDLPVLGEDVFELRDLLYRVAGDRAHGVSEGIWLEAYAAQLILDLRTLAPERAYVPLWPRAMFELRGWADLHVLAELDRMLVGSVSVVGYRSEAPPLLMQLAGSPGAARRVTRAYCNSMQRIVDNAGWSQVGPSAP